MTFQNQVNTDSHVPGRLVSPSFRSPGPASHLRVVLQLAHSQGVRVNEEKSLLTPVQSLQYLGVTLDFKNQVILPTPGKCQEVRRMDHHKSLSAPSQRVEHLLGKLTSSLRRCRRVDFTVDHFSVICDKLGPSIGRGTPPY